jgi:hypothetical protein
MSNTASDTPTGPYTVRRWAHGHAGAVVLENGSQILSTSTDALTRKLIKDLTATLAPQNLAPPVVSVELDAAEPENPSSGPNQPLEEAC